MVTHTPGPWSYEVHELSEGLAGIVYGPDGMRIGTDYLSEADAALIAAAPDLLAALCSLVDAAEQQAADDGEDDLVAATPEMDAVRAAIAKAEPAR